MAGKLTPVCHPLRPFATFVAAAAYDIDYSISSRRWLSKAYALRHGSPLNDSPARIKFFNNAMRRAAWTLPESIRRAFSGGK